MPVRCEGDSSFKKWAALIKADKISDVLLEVVEGNIAEDKALECLVYMSQLAYKDAQNGVPFASPPDDILHLTEVLSTSVISQPSLCNLRFISSLYHIAFFFYKNNHPVYLKTIGKIILETKKTNKSCFQGDGTKVYENFIVLFKKAIPNLAINKGSRIDQSVIKECLTLHLDLCTVENELENGSVFLETVLYASHMIARENKKTAVYFICKGLQLFFKVKTIKDLDCSLTLMFKLFSSLFNYQLDITGYASALELVLSYVDTNKWKFGEESVLHGGCFCLMSQAKMFLTSQSEVAIRKMILNVNMILNDFKSAREKKDFVKEAGLLMLSFVSNLKMHKTIGTSVLLGVCLEPFMEMILSLCDALKGFNVEKCYYIYCIANSFLLASEAGRSKQDLLKECLKTLLKAEAVLFEVSDMLRSENHPKADCYTKLILTRSANLLHSYHLASLEEEIIAFSQPICKYICTLPSYIFEDSSSKSSMELSFTCLIQALGPLRLYEVLETAVAWLIVCHESSDKVFRLWGDIKHNAICAGGSEFLDTTVFTIVNEGKPSLEEKWLPFFHLPPAQLGDLLVKELNTYFINSTLRGSPVLEAAQALESLATDVLTQVRGLVVALDVTSARSEYAEQCSHYHERSKLLLSTLKKQKNKIDPVVFNCCMAELLYAQFRFKLKSFRLDCEGEVLRLTALHVSAGPLIPELPEDQPDPDDTCDVTTRYTNLSLEKQKEILAELNTAITHWRAACTRLTAKEDSKNTRYDLRVTLKNLQEAAFIMKLYCDKTKEDELWRLLYNMARLVDDTNKMIIAIGEMLESKNSEFLDDAEILLQRPGVTEKTKDTFTLNRALFHLSSNEIAEGVKFLTGNAEIRKNLSSIHYINYLVILGLYQKMSDWQTYSEQFLFSPSCHQSFHKALSHLLYLTQQERWSSLMEASQIQLSLLRVSHQLGEINWSLEQPREARCYLKSQLSVAQKLGLPLRSSQLLVVLAWVDLHTGMMADCAVKLEGLEALLDIQGAPKTYEAGTDNSAKLSKGEIWDPEFLSHHRLFPGCDCFACSCIEYQRLVLETLTLRAIYCANNHQPSLALQSFKVAFRVRDYLSKSNDLEVQKSSARMWKCYANTLALCSEPQEDLDISKKAFAALPSIKHHPILLQHILHHKSCQQNLTNGQNKPIGHKIVIDHEENSSVDKTPLNKQGKILPTKIPLSVVNGNITPKFVRRVRKLTLPSSGEENTPPPSTTLPKLKRTIKLPSKINIETPQTTCKVSKRNKTPFTIVDDDGNAVGMVNSKLTGSSRAKRKTEVKISTSVHKNLFESNNRCTDQKTIASKVFKSPERKSNRKPKVNLNEKSNPSKDDSLKKIVSTNGNKSINNESEILIFDDLKQEINNIKRSIPAVPKSTYSKKTLKQGSVTGTRSHPGSSKGDVESDCSVVEGTPTPPRNKKITLRTLKPKRATTK